MLHRTAHQATTIFAAVALTAVVAACGTGSQASGGSNPGSGQGAGMTISFATPTDGATVSIPFNVELQSSVPLGAPETGNHHAHLYFDTSTDSADYDIVYGTTWQVTRQLSPGTHTIIVAMANPDHSLAGPTSQITVTVGASGGGGAPAATSTPSSY